MQGNRLERLFRNCSPLGGLKVANAPSASEICASSPPGWQPCRRRLRWAHHRMNAQTPQSANVHQCVDLSAAWCRILICLSAFMAELCLTADVSRGQEGSQRALPVIREFCFDCHEGANAEAGVDLSKLLSDESSYFTKFRTWEKVASMLPETRCRPATHRSRRTSSEDNWWKACGPKFTARSMMRAGDPGPLVIRRLTAAEYRYTIADLTGIDLDLERDFVSDAVGGEGFANVGDVQFMQDSTLERYLEAAHRVAEHAVRRQRPDVLFSGILARPEWSCPRSSGFRRFTPPTVLAPAPARADLAIDLTLTPKAFTRLGVFASRSAGYSVGHIRRIGSGGKAQPPARQAFVECFQSTFAVVSTVGDRGQVESTAPAGRHSRPRIRRLRAGLRRTV